MAEVTTSLVVQFRNEGAGSLIAEIDGRPGGYNNGRISFVPGDQPAFLVYRSFNVSIVELLSSVGTIVPLAPVIVPVVDYLHFAKADEAQLSKPYFSGMTAKWLGNNLGAVTLVGDQTLRVAAAGVGVLKVAYNARALAYRFNGIPTVLNGETTFEVIAVITGEFP